MITTFMVSLFIFTSIKETFSKTHSSLRWQKTLIPMLSIYIINHYLNKKKIYVFELYFFKFKLFIKFFSIFFKFLFENRKLCLKLFNKKFIYFLSIIYIFIRILNFTFQKSYITSQL